MHAIGFSAIILASLLFIAAPIVTGLTDFGWEIVLETVVCLALPPSVLWAVGSLERRA